jgi:hypothetical protein
MNGLILFIGESFRLGYQHTRCRGKQESFAGQIIASKSHINFVDSIITKFSLKSISIFVTSYNTQFNNDLLKIYEKYLIGYEFYDNPIGLNNLFHNSINKIENIEEYDFIYYIRIDIFLKKRFIDVFNPYIEMILYPTICWYYNRMCNNDPRVNDTSLFIPKKYYKYIKNVVLCHDLWHLLVNNTDLNYDDMDVLINTYHDSDSSKDNNPLYYIVNRSERKKHHSRGYIFNKYNFR